MTRPTVQPSAGLGCPPSAMVRGLPLLAVLLAACGGFHTPPQDATVGLAARAEQRNDSNTTLVVTRMRVVVGALELTRDDGSIEQLPGPFLVDPALDGSYTQIAEHAVGHGAYTTLQLTLRPLSASAPAEVKLAHDHGFDELLQSGAALAFEGRYGPEGQEGEAFDVQVPGMVQKTISITNEFDVKLGADANVTLSTDLKEWFALDAQGHPIDPRASDSDDTLRAFTTNLRASTDDDRNGTPDP